MKIETLNLNKIKVNKLNSKKHPVNQIRSIADSIEKFGNNDPIAVDENNVIIEGHGRFEALKLLNADTADIIRLSHLTNDEKRLYGVVHNKLTLDSKFDMDKLRAELAEIPKIDLGKFNLDLTFENPYTQKVETPKYFPRDISVKLDELYDSDKYYTLIKNIEKSEIDAEIKEMLKIASTRHIKFNFSKIADYYAQADADVQRLMEENALVIIDFNDAIEQGYVKLSKKMREMYE